MVVGKTRSTKRRLTLIATAVGALLLGVGAGAGGSYWYWQNYDQKAEQRQQALANQAERALVEKVTTSESRQKKLHALKTLAESSNQLANDCRVAAWQPMFGAAKRRHDACYNEANKAKQFGADLAVAVRFVDEEATLWASVTPLLKLEVGDDSTWQATADKWGQAVEQIKKQSVVSSLTPVKASLIENASNIHGIWKDMAASASKKDRVAYKAARGKLVSAYESLRVVPATSEESYSKVLKKVHTSYEAAFSH